MTKKAVNLSFYSNLETTTNTTQVVHCKKSEYDVYIGRPALWGNPYSSKKGTLTESARFGGSSKTTRSASSTQASGEVNRWAKLAGLK